MIFQFVGQIAWMVILLPIVVAVLVVIVRRLTRPPQPTQVSGYGEDVDAAVAGVRQRFDRRARYAVHAALYTGYALAVFVFLLDPLFWRSQFGALPNTGDLMLVALLWGLAFAAHSASFFVQEAGDRALRREIEAIRASQRSKPKRSHERLLLTDDGEVETLTLNDAGADRRILKGKA
jgi:hypothetical protein